MWIRQASLSISLADTGGTTEASGEPRLVLRAARGERGAFGLLYQRHVERVFNYVVFRVRDTAMAEDLTQDIFISAYRGLAALEQADRFGPWLMAIARNRLRNHWRAAGRAPDTAEPGDDGDPLEQVPAEDVLAVLEERVAAEDLLASATILTELQQEVLGLRFVAGLDVATTADLMGRSENAVKNLQFHALAAMRRHVAAARGGP
jgi:RNA polymerase sigma-70 factor, ECF subfamily